MKFRIIKRTDRINGYVNYGVQVKRWWWPFWVDIKFWYQPEIMDMPGWWSKYLADEDSAKQLIRNYRNGCVQVASAVIND